MCILAKKRKTRFLSSSFSKQNFFYSKQLGLLLLFFIEGSEKTKIVLTFLEIYLSQLSNYNQGLYCSSFQYLLFATPERRIGQSGELLPFFPQGESLWVDNLRG